MISTSLHQNAFEDTFRKQMSNWCGWYPNWGLIFIHTYCSVDSSARKFPSFPLDHLLMSASRYSANLCNHSLIEVCQLRKDKSTTLLHFVDYDNFTFLSACSLCARMSRMFFSARAFAWKHKWQIFRRLTIKFSGPNLLYR